MMHTRENSATVMPGLRLSWGGLHPDGRVPVLLVPGYGDSWRFWLPLFPYFPDSLRVFALSPRGHGTSDAPATGYTVADNAEDLARVLDAVHVTKAIVVGHSSGGYVARQFAVDHPDRVQALALVGSPLSLHGRRAPFSALVESMQGPVDPATVHAFAAGFTRYADVDPAVRDAVLNDALRMPARAWQQTLAGLTEADAPPLGRINAPTLVAWGADDELIGPAEQRVLAESIPGARQRQYPVAGHLVAWDVPTALASASSNSHWQAAGADSPAGTWAPPSVGDVPPSCLAFLPLEKPRRELGFRALGGLGFGPLDGQHGLGFADVSDERPQPSRLRM